MSVKISDAIRQHLGWCPNAQGLPRPVAVMPYEQMILPGSGGEQIRPVFRWYREFRFQMMVLGIVTCLFVLLQSAVLGEARIVPAIAGVIVAVPLSAITIVHYRNFFRDVMENGAGNERSWCRGSGRYIVCLELAVIVALVALLCFVVLGWVPGLDASILASFTPGMVITYTCLFLLYVVVWERKTGLRIYMKWPFYYCRKIDR